MNATTRTLEQLRRLGIEVLDLTVSNPTRVGLDYPEDLLRSFSAAQALRYDPDPLGMWSAREAVAADFARRGLRASPQSIALTASTSEAYAWLFKLLCDPGDNVLVPRPSYPLFDHLTMLESVEARSYISEYHGTWRVDLAQIEGAIDSQTKAILVVSPNNPTGAFVDQQDLAALDTLCAARGIVIIADEVFADFPLQASGSGPSALTATQAVVCALGGLSKSVGLPQVKLAWIAFSGPEPKIRELLAAYELIADTYLSVSTPVQVALPDLLTRGVVVREQIQQRLRENLEALERAVAVRAEVSLFRPEGG